MDPTATALVSKLATEANEILKKESESFLSAVLGEPARALGGLLADQINARRHANLIAITARAMQDLNRAHRKPEEIPLKIIHPALDAASLEDDPTLQGLWAALLASAATPDGAIVVRPAFISVLKQMSSEQALLLGWIADNPIRGNQPVTLSSLHERCVSDTGVKLSTATFRSSLEELAASQLIYLSPLATAVHNSFIDDNAVLIAPMREPYHLTHRGLELVKACRAPGQAL